jgi:MarR family transcriptional regulator, organic hydroperoxide resistance regulator
MDKDILEKVSEELLSTPPLIFRLIRKKIARTAVNNLDSNITPLQFEIMMVLEEDNTLHVSEIGERLQIARAQMTKLIEKLVGLNLIERHGDMLDRRSVNIQLTDRGKLVLKEQKNMITRAANEIISSLSHEDLERLSVSIRNLREILLKV